MNPTRLPCAFWLSVECNGRRRIRASGLHATPRRPTRSAKPHIRHPLRMRKIQKRYNIGLRSRPDMQLLAIGINHHTAPVALRERVAFPLEQIKPALLTLKQAWLGRDTRRADAPPKLSVAEAAILSTCNRTELYCAT